MCVQLKPCCADHCAVGAARPPPPVNRPLHRCACVRACVRAFKLKIEPTFWINQAQKVNNQVFGKWWTHTSTKQGWTLEACPRMRPWRSTLPSSYASLRECPCSPKLNPTFCFFDFTSHLARERDLRQRSTSWCRAPLRAPAQPHTGRPAQPSALATARQRRSSDILEPCMCQLVS